MKTANVLILTDDSEFARLLTACWRTERRAPAITVLNTQDWQSQNVAAYDLSVIGGVASENLPAVLERLNPETVVILCASDPRGIQQLRARYQRLIHVPLREDWTQTLLLVAGESLRRVEAERLTEQALSRAARSDRDAVLGRYMLEMKHSVNNALTSILGNAELLLLEPGQLSAQSLQQIRTVQQMTLRLNEIMQRFSSLASEIRAAETASQPETDEMAVSGRPRL